MSRVLMLLFLFTADAVLFAAGSPDLLVAIRYGDHSRVQQLLGAGADANTVDSDGTTALMHAVVESDVKMMKLLIDRGANVWLLSKGVDPNAKNDRGDTPYQLAASSIPSPDAARSSTSELVAQNGGCSPRSLTL